MIIETDTAIATLLNMAEKIHDELDSYGTHPTKHVTEEMQEAIREYQEAHQNLQSVFTDARRDWDNV